LPVRPDPEGSIEIAKEKALEQAAKRIYEKYEDAP
jgi:hypothetical protein